jgi:serine/threonine-protein kinase
MAPEILRLTDHFALEGEAGRGGFGVVFRARHRATGELAAAKVSHAAASPEDVARVSREVSLVSALEHPHLARLHGLFLSDDGHPALVYEWLEGGALSEQAGAAADEVLRWMEEAAAALDALHRGGLVHRDVKPENLMLDGTGRVRLVDYGLLRPEADGRTITATGVILGTPAFMPPEAFRGDRVGPAGDRFALAATAYWLLTGRPPFGAESPGDIVRAQGAPPPPPREVGAAAPALARAFATGLAPDPGDRPASCGALAQALRQAWRSEEAASAPDAPTVQVQARPLRSPSTPRRVGDARPRPRRNLRGPLAVLAIGTAVAYLLLRGPPPPPPDPPTRPAEVPPPKADPFAPEALVRARDRLNDLQARFTDHRARRLSDAEAASTRDKRLVLDGDPVYWPWVLDELPELRECLRLLADREALERQSAVFQEEAAETDRLFRAQDLPLPFAPFVGLLPSEDPEPYPVIQDARLEERVPASLRVPLRGWAGTALRELSQASESLRARGTEVIAGRVDMTSLPFLQGTLRVHNPRDEIDLMVRPFSSPQTRIELARYFAAEVEGLHRGLLAAGRSLREEPESRSLVALMVGDVFRGPVEAAHRSYLALLPLELITGPLDTSDPDVAYLVYHLPGTRKAGINASIGGLVDLSGVTARLEATARAATKPADTPADTPAARRRRISAYAELIMGLVTLGRIEAALEASREVYELGEESGEALPAYLITAIARALERAGGGLPPALARTCRDDLLARPDLERSLSSAPARLDDAVKLVRWVSGTFDSATMEELTERLNAAVAQCELEATGG